MYEELITLRNVELLSTKGFTLGSAIPTQSSVQKWLREKHLLNIYVNFKPNIKKWDFISYSMSMSEKEYIKYYSEYFKLHGERSYNSYEEALEDGIYEALHMLP